MKNARVKNNEPIATEEIPVADYEAFLEEIVACAVRKIGEAAAETFAEL